METRNAALDAWMVQHQMSAAGLADALNDAIRDFTGRTGTTSERTVFRWLSGESRWPQGRQRRAVETVTGLSAVELGFTPRGTATPHSSPPEADMRRRQFCSTAAAFVPLATPPAYASRVGTGDVLRLREDMERLVDLDAARGGHETLERASLAGAAEALQLQRQSATQRVRQRLFALAADFTATAGWSLVDAGQLAAAERHLDRSLTLAGLAQDSEMVMQAWNLRAMLARQRCQYGEAVAAAQAAKATTVARRSPLHTSLAQARVALGLARCGEQSAALRCLGRAEEALSKTDLDHPVAPWISFYGPAELHALTAIVRDVLGDPAGAESAAHQALAALPASYRRNRAHTTARLALAQLHQDDIEQACATSGTVFTIMEGAPLPGRVRQLLGDFQRDLLTRAPTANLAHEWTDRYRTEGSTP